MKELFVPYQESLELKKLEFDEDCIATYEEVLYDITEVWNYISTNVKELDKLDKNSIEL